MDDLERLKLLAWIGFGLWILTSVFVTYAMVRAAFRGRGPFTISNSLLMVSNMVEASLYLFLIYHPGHSWAEWAPDFILYAVIFRAIVFLVLGAAWYWEAQGRRRLRDAAE